MTTNTPTNTAFDKIFRDSEGNIVIAQPPNLPLIVWGAATLLQLIVTTGKINTVRCDRFWCFVYLGVGGIISRR